VRIFPVVLAAILLVLQTVSAQPSTPLPAVPSAPTPDALIVGSGNYFSPIVANLDEAVAFYRDGLGLEVQGAPGDAAANPALRAMFGLPDAMLRWQIARTPAAPGGVEIVEISAADGKPLERRIQDPGAVTLLLAVRDLDAILARLKKLGAPIVTPGGAPVPLMVGPRTARAIAVQDPAGHFVELLEIDGLQVPPTTNVIDVRVVLTVDDVDQAARLYGSALGLKAQNVPAFRADPPASVFGHGGESRVAIFEVPTSGLTLELMDFRGVDRRSVQGRIQDFGSTRIQLRVRDIDAAIAELIRSGGEVVSTGGKALDLPAGNSKLRVAIVRDPNNLFVVLIEAPPPA
jgi:catechol 2,3-dioxygenase-like lactoylglutathione lyase family enzyme